MMNAYWRPGPAGAPLVVLLHGRGSDEASLVALAESFPSRFAVALPRGPLVLESGGYTWFENRGLGYPLGPSLRASADLLHAWLDELDAERFDLRRIIIGGFSAGMLMASAMLLDRPERFHAGVLLSGTLPWDIDEIVPTALQLRGKPVFHAHGDKDRVIPLDLVARSEAYLINESGAQVDHHRYPIAHEISADEHRTLLAWFARTIS
jgi:phospholipase/carboxylesterase